MPTRPLAAGACLLTIANLGGAQARLSLDSLFDNTYQSQGFGPAWWLADSGLATLEPAEGGGRDLVRYDPQKDAREILISAAQLTPAGRDRPLHVAGYEFSADGRKLLIFTNTRRVWRYHTRGDYWVLDRDSGKLWRLGKGLDASRLQFARFDPAANRVAYLYRKDIYVEALDSGHITRLTTDGSDTLTNGTFDWVYEEEWGLRDGFRWSPDGKRIAFWQIDAKAVGEFTLIDNTSGLYSKPFRYRYPKVGTTNPTCRIGVLAADAPAGSTPIRWMKVPGDPSQDYIARMEWAANSEELVLQHFNRAQTRNQVRLADVSTGATRVIHTDQGDAWVEECDDLRWFDGGKRFMWVSEADGWRHAYVISRDGKQVQLVTPGDYDVVSIAHIDEAGGFLYVIASPQTATQRFLYRVPLTGGPPQRITPHKRGTHSYQIAPNGRFATHRWSAFGVPETVHLISLPEHKVLRTLSANEGLKQRLAQLETGSAEFFRIDIGDGVDLDGYVRRPPGFDPQKKYPLLVFVYGEPAAQTVLDRWGGFNDLWHRMLTQQGYVVLSMDNRGTPGPRGRAWRKSVYKKIGILAPKDQAAGLRALQERWPWLDRSRTAIWGWSGGGSMSLNAIFRYPELYHTAMAIAFVADQRYYDTIYQERYMSTPQLNPEGFRDGSPITHAKNLKGNLLLIYGTGDDNCHYQNCEALVDELIRHGKQFDMQIYPNRTHAIREGAGTRRHLYTRMTNYLKEHVPAGAR